MLCGLAVLPCRRDQSRLIDFQKEHRDLLSGPELGLSENLPHVSVFQSQFDREDLSENILETVRAEALLSGKEKLTSVLTSVGYQPDNWAFVHVGCEDWMIDLQRSAISSLGDLIRADEIDLEKDFGGYSKQEAAYYGHYGYRYVGSEFRPHFTIGRTPKGQDYVPSSVVCNFAKKLAGIDVAFERLAFYEAGESGAFARTLAEVDLP